MAIYFDNSMVNVGGGSSEDLSAELAEYTALNAELEEVIDSLPDAGSSGGIGGGVETCTVEITSDSYANIIELSYSYLAADRKVSTSYTRYETGVENANIRLENVVCGSLVYAWAESLLLLRCVPSDNVRLLDFDNLTCFEAPTTANSIGTIHFSDDG